jgi:nitroreductase
MEKRATTGTPIHELLARRWSPRAMDPGRKVTREMLQSLLEAARWAPSCFNEQPWRFLVFDGSVPEALEAARGCLAEGNAWARRAPLLLLSVARDTFTRNGKLNRYAGHDVGLATENLVLQATALGLASHQMAGFDAERARRAFHIPDGFTPMAMIAVGHPGSADDLDEGLQQREMAPRVRRELEEIAFSGDWERRFSS